jgi:DNA-directed RNA polymerase subunit RPC12/RpoP
MIENEHDTTPHICFECDSEFIVHTPYESELSVSFCPYCGSEVDPGEDEIDDDGYEDDDNDSLVYR